MRRHSQGIRSFFSLIRDEYRAIFSDAGAVLILVLALLIYTTLYSAAYAPQVLRNVPIGVIDKCNTAASRALIRTFDAGPNTYTAYEPSDMDQAQELFFARKIYGIVYIPENYERQLASGSQAVVSIYADASYFLVYRQVFQELVTGIGRTGAAVEYGRLLAKGASAPSAQAITQPVIYRSHNLYNPYLGYGSFVMPAIIMVIIQQTLLIGIGLVGGTRRETGYFARLASDPHHPSPFVLLWAKTVAYASIYALTSLYVLSLHYKLFHYPMNGTTAAVIIFTSIYVLACIFAAIAVSTLFRRRENALMLLLWTSIPIIMLSGASFPEQGIPGWLYNAGRIFPSSSGVRGFIRIQTMGASLRDVWPEIRMLLWLLIAYGALACIGIRCAMRRDGRE